MFLILAASLASAAAPAPIRPQAICPYGAIYRTFSGKRILVKRYATGRSSFFADGSHPNFGEAFDFVVEKTRERGQIYGPTRSYMCVTYLAFLKRLGYRCRKVPADPGGFYRVMSHDGDKEIMHFLYV